MKLGLLSVCLVVIAAGCATANPRRVATPKPALAERLDPDKTGAPKRQRIPRWVAPPPAYGNRVVSVESETPAPEG
jgi:hypothetical protein